MKNPNVFSKVNFNKNYEPLEKENPELMIDFGYIRQGYGAIDFSGIYNRPAQITNFVPNRNYLNL